MTPSESHDALEPPVLAAPLVQWMAVQALQDRFARLAEGGPDVDARIELASLFIDLPVWIPHRAEASPRQELWAMVVLLGGASSPDAEDADVEPCPRGGRQRWLLMGGPGSGKSTLTTMVAQQLRLPWLDRQSSALPEHLREPWARAREGLDALAVQGKWSGAVRALPLRVNLPLLARWMAAQGDHTALSLWDYLAARLVEDLAGNKLTTEITSGSLRTMVEQATAVTWILDGLDEVPHAAGRGRVIDLVRATVCDVVRPMDSVLVSTRPQGYDREFNDLDVVELRPLPVQIATKYAERLLYAWSSRDASSNIAARLEKMRAEFAKPEVIELIQTPLHTTMAALLVASRGSLPSARSMLFEHYFETILRRELGKPFDHGIQDVDGGVLRALHSRAGIVLQVRSQAQKGARASLRRRELRELLAAIYAELGVRSEDARAHVDRMMRFAADRLVLLLHNMEGEYEFGVRSLQEFFAAQALLEGDASAVRARLDVIAIDSHWSNVLAFVVSSSALKTVKLERERALALTASLCHSLNQGHIGGDAAARCFMGSRLAIQMLRETERYGHPWIHEPLWDIALVAASSPTQSTSAQVVNSSATRHRRGTWTDTVELHTRLGLLAARWTGTDGELYRRRLIESAKNLLKGDADERLNGWRLLHGLLLESAPEAVRLAEEHAPSTREEARSVAVAMIANNEVRPPPWFYAFLAQHPEWFSPGWPLLHPLGATKELPVAFRIAHQLHRVESIHLKWERLDGAWGAEIDSVESDTKEWREIKRVLPGGSPAWTLWERIVSFMSAPSHALLADILEAIADAERFREMLNVCYWFPWPLRACLVHVREADELLALSAKVRTGNFGSISDWRAAEARWRTSGSISMDDLRVSIGADGPWNQDISSRGIVLSGASLFRSISGREEAAIRVFMELLDWIERSVAGVRKAVGILGQLAFGGLRVSLSAARLGDRDPDDPLLWPLYSLTTLLPELTGPEAEGWFALLDKRGRAGRNESEYVGNNDPLRKAEMLEIARALIDRLRRHPEQWGLMDAIERLLRSFPDIDISELHLPDLPDDAPTHALATRAALALLSGRSPPTERSTLLAQLRFDDGGTPVDFRVPLAHILRNRTQGHEAAIPLLLAALDAQPPPSGSVRDALLGALFGLLRRSISPSFASPDAWRAHDLPQPFLAGLAPPQRPPRLLSIIELRNLRLFRETPKVDIPFPQPSAERGQWIVLVGENGVGKTTLLRGLALALASPTIASRLLDERLPMMRNGAEGRVSIELDTGTLSIALLRGERTERIESLSPSDALRPWVVGYGVRRGNARGEKDREAEVGPIGELHTLFDRPASLHNAVQWLKDLDADVLREQRRGPRGTDSPPGPREGIWQSVQHALHVLLGVTKVEVDEGGAVYVQHPQFDRVRLDALSDGYLTTAGWVVDMIARWIERQHELDEPVGADVLSQMCGFVLIDELDLHLHPMWQMRIIEDVRRLFPRLSFVVTTHNPLTLQGARPGEVYVLRREGPGIVLVQRDIRPGQDVDRVLFEQFGVEHTFDRETRDLLRRHREIVGRGVAPDDDERVKLERQLTERFGDVGDALRGERSDARGPVAPLRPDERSLLSPFLKKKA